MKGCGGVEEIVMEGVKEGVMEGRMGSCRGH